MKCFCGYDELDLYEYQIYGDFKRIFIGLNLVECIDDDFENDVKCTYEDVDIFRCPKCGTLKGVGF